MWAGSLSHNDLTGCGHPSVFINHKNRARTLREIRHRPRREPAIAFPPGQNTAINIISPAFAQYAVRVWGCEMDYANPEATALAGIAATEAFFRSMGIPVRLADIGIGESEIEELADRISIGGTSSVKSYVECGKKEFSISSESPCKHALSAQGVCRSPQHSHSNASIGKARAYYLNTVSFPASVRLLTKGKPRLLFTPVPRA